MKRYGIPLALLILVSLVVTSPVSAHTIRYTTGTGGMVVTALFDDGRPARDMFVSVFAPGLEERFQSGKTDRNGRFAFFPDRSGIWEILVYDRMGHRLEVKMTVNSALCPEEDKKPDQSDRGLKILMGLSTIAVLFSGLRLVKKKNKADC